MVLVKVLERKDAASLVVAIAGGYVLGVVAFALSSSLVSWVLDSGPDLDFKVDILQPLLILVLVGLLLEGLARLVIALRGSMSR